MEEHDTHILAEQFGLESLEIRKLLGGFPGFLPLSCSVAEHPKQNPRLRVSPKAPSSRPARPRKHTFDQGDRSA